MNSETINVDLSERIRDLEIKQAALDARVSTSTMVFYAVTLLLAVLGSVAGYNLLTYRKFEVARDSVYRIMVDNLQRDVGHFFNGFAVRSPDSDQLARWQQLNAQVESLEAVGVKDPRFHEIKTFVSLLADVCQFGHELPKEREQVLDRLILFASDPFVQSRATALRGLMRLSRGNWEYSEEIEKDFSNALDKDKSVGPAWSGLGILYRSKAKAAFQKDFESGLQFLRLALNYIEHGHGLDNSLQGAVKYKNNRVWFENLLFEVMITGHLDETRFLAYVGALTPEIFIARSSRELEFGRKRLPERMAQYETTAELYGLTARYYVTRDPTKSEAYLKLSLEEYIGAIRRDLVAKVRVNDALMNFEKMTALNLVRERHGDLVRQEIRMRALKD